MIVCVIMYMSVIICMIMCDNVWMSDGIRKMRQDEIDDEEDWCDKRNEERLCDEEEEKIRSDMNMKGYDLIRSVMRSIVMRMMRRYMDDEIMYGVDEFDIDDRDEFFYWSRKKMKMCTCIYVVWKRCSIKW